MDVRAPYGLSREEVIERWQKRIPPPVPPAPIPASQVPALAQARVLTDHDVALLVANATIDKPGINLEGANLATAQLTNMTFNRPFLSQAVLAQANLNGSTIFGDFPNNSLLYLLQFNACLATLRSSLFSGVMLEACTFSNADFGFATIGWNTAWAFCNFNTSSWLQTVFQGAVAPGSPTVSFSTFQGAIFNQAGVQLTFPNQPVIFNQCDFTKAIFDNCAFQSVIFKKCIFGRSLFRETELSGAIFESCELSSAVFDSCRTTGVSFL